ncbi:MAG: MBL fold metallo-hydrolase [Deltaproteobacteria bacterium]|nr:MBL fold metallo-hydrolase [Deltaproteobacteria bacterium]
MHNVLNWFQGLVKYTLVVVISLFLVVIFAASCAHIPEVNPLCAPGVFGERVSEQTLPYDIRSIPCEYAKCWTIPVDDKGGVVLVDTGMDPEAKELIQHLQKRRIEVRAVLLTHGHLDHAGAAYLFAEQGIPVYLQDPDLPFLRLQRRHRAILPRIGQFFLPSPIAPEESFSPRDRTWLHFEKNSIQVVHLPGHTPGSSAYLVGEVLFTGDALVGPNPGGLCAAPPQVNESNDAAWRTLSRLADLPFSMVADGHYGVTRDAKRALELSKKKWRQQLKSRQ